MSKFVNKSGKGKAVVTGEGDLIADVKNGNKKLADIPAAELPAPMQKMTLAEQEAYVTAQAQKRDELARQLAEKSSQRDAFIKEAEAKKATATAGDSFDQAVSRTLEKQIK
jgi:hypothetical protein